MLINEITEGTRCWKGYKKKGMKTMFGKRVPNCVKNEAECKDGEYFCNTDQKCKPIPDGHTVDKDGILVKEVDSNPDQRIDDKEFKSTLSKKDQKFMKKFDKNQHSTVDPFHRMKQVDIDLDIAGDEDELEKNLQKEKNRKQIIKVVNNLPSPYKDMLVLRFGLHGKKDYHLEQIADMFGITREMARALEAKALRMLRHPDRLGSMALPEDLRAWFGKGKKGGAGGGGWDRYNSKGERVGKCGDGKGKGKPKCLSKSAAAKLRNADKNKDGKKDGKAGIAKAVKRKQRNDPNKNRRGKAKNVKN